jgi:hypothetical protein
MNRDTQNSIEGRARDVQRTVAGQADGRGEQGVHEAQQLIGKIRRILGQSAFVPDHSPAGGGAD